MDYKCLQGYQVMMTSNHLHLYATRAKLVSQVSEPRQYNLSFHWANGLPFVRDKKIPRHELRSNLTSHLTISRPKNVGKIVNTWKMSLIKRGSARCHSLVWNRECLNQREMVSAYRLFSFGARVAMLEMKGFSLTCFLFPMPEQNSADWAPKYLDFLFLLTEQTTSNERRQYTVNTRWHSDGGELKTN